ncbi:MAG: alpha/beta fold hydrolase [Actinomycetota bacterium]
MTTANEPTNRVTSRDGTEIAYWTSGEGRPLVLVHGTTADHSRWATLLPYLEPHVTAHAIDRRGRGGSGDGPAYDIEREYEDVAAVVDAVAASTGSSVDVLGHSYGGACAYGAATLTPNIGRLVLYEGWAAPHPENLALPPGLHERMQAMLAAGDREDALEAFIREVVRMPDKEFEVYRSLPAWKARVAAAHTIPRETRSYPAFDPVQASKITVPVLLLVGADSPDSMKNDYETVAAELPDARVQVLAGQQHVAIDLIPEEFARRVVAFLRR